MAIAHILLLLFTLLQMAHADEPAAPRCWAAARPAAAFDFDAGYVQCNHASFAFVGA